MIDAGGQDGEALRMPCYSLIRCWCRCSHAGSTLGAQMAALIDEARSRPRGATVRALAALNLADPGVTRQPDRCGTP